jgi:hypothetical protein
MGRVGHRIPGTGAGSEEEGVNSERGYEGYEIPFLLLHSLISWGGRL